MDSGNATLKVSTFLMNGCSEQEVADGVAPWCAGLGRESESQEICCCGLCVREGNKAVPEIPNRRNSKLLAQHSRRAAVIPHGDDCR